MIYTLKLPTGQSLKYEGDQKSVELLASSTPGTTIAELPNFVAQTREQVNATIDANKGLPGASTPNPVVTAQEVSRQNELNPTLPIIQQNVVSSTSTPSTSIDTTENITLSQANNYDFLKSLIMPSGWIQDDQSINYVMGQLSDPNTAQSQLSIIRNIYNALHNTTDEYITDPNPNNGGRKIPNPNYKKVDNTVATTSTNTSTPSTTQEVQGTPKSSDEYDQWIAMGRKFNPTTGKWTETVKTTGVTGVNYKIQSGDTLSAIALKNGITVQALMDANPGITDPNKIYAGQNLIIPGSTAGVGEGGVDGGAVGAGGDGSATGDTGDTTGGAGGVTEQTVQSPSDFSTLYTQALKDTGVSDIKTQFEAVVKEQTDLTNEMNDKIADVNENPWMSQSVRNREIARIQSRYEGRLTTLTNEQKLFDSLYQQGIAEAKFLATGEAEQQQFILKYIQDAEDAKAKLQQQAIDNKDKSLKSVNGGLYDTSTNSWIVAPSSSGTGGLSTAQMNSTINSIANSFDNEQTVKDYNQATSQYQLMNSIGTKTSSPGDDIAFVYAFAKIMDPNSVVREGEYNTVQKYAQSFLDAKTLEAIRLVKNTNFLSADAKQQLLNAAGAKMKVLDSQYQNVYGEYQRRINNVSSGGYNTITDYSQAFGGSNSSNIDDIQALRDAGYTDEQITEILNQ